MLNITLEIAKKKLRDAAIDSAALDAELLLCKVLGKSREYLLRGEGEVTRKQQTAFETLLQRRIAREPMAHLLGVREFWGRSFIVTKDTLDPRPDSETLIEAVLDKFPNKTKTLKVLDIGVGTGCLLLTILAEYPHAQGVGLDISKAALDVADKNGKQLGLAARVEWHAMDIVRYPKVTCGKEAFDLVITNPPYIKSSDIKNLAPEVAKYEPKEALDGGGDGFRCYQDFAPVIAALLKEKGIAIIEAGKGQDHGIIAFMKNVGLVHLKTLKDLGGVGRAVVFKK